MDIVLLLIIGVNTASAKKQYMSPYKVHQVIKEPFWGPEPLIFSGEEAKDNQFPYMIFIGIFSSYKIDRCSGSLVHPDVVLTAAHCLATEDLRSEDLVLAGGKANLLPYARARLSVPRHLSLEGIVPGVQERRAVAFFTNPKYNGLDYFYDVGLIKLNKPFLSPRVTTIPISREKMKQPMYCTIVGWGLTPQSKENFKLNFGHKMAKTTEMGCAYHGEGPILCLGTDDTGICSGDSGGPLVCDDKVWGVASFYLYDISEECGDSLEDYYSEIYSNLDWLSYGNSGNLSAVVTTKTFLLLTIFWLFLRSILYIYKI